MALATDQPSVTEEDYLNTELVARHRSLTNCMINVAAGFLAYSYQEKRPSLNIRVDKLLPLLG